jgi:hypothetical protein
MRRLLALLVTASLGTALAFQVADPPAKKPAGKGQSAKSHSQVELTKLGKGKFAHFTNRRAMQNSHPFKRFIHRAGTIPPTTLPVDSTGNATVSAPLDGNDTLGDCGEAMVCHCDNILTFGQGKAGWTESVFGLAALEAQYEKVSGGDNGLDEDMVVNQIWKVGIAGNAKAIITDALDMDVTNVPLTQFAIDNFYTVELAWSVPDAFVNGFATGTVWAAAGTPDPNNGHYTPLADVGGPATTQEGYTGSLNGFYRLWTWGTWCWVSPAFVASVQPQAFIAFSPRQFSTTTGLDSKGRHITQQAALWVTCGGNPIPQAVIDAFPPLSPSPTPTPTPTPTPAPTPAPAPASVFTISFGTAISAGQRVRIPAFAAPNAIPAGLYDVVPSQATKADVRVK